MLQLISYFICVFFQASKLFYLSFWVLYLLYEYGSMTINTIFSGMNIHKSQLFWCSPGVQGFDTLPYMKDYIKRKQIDDNLGSLLAQDPLPRNARFFSGCLRHEAILRVKRCSSWGVFNPSRDSMGYQWNINGIFIGKSKIGLFPILSG